ncbi:hypothetical protein [Geobacter sp.]|uniref:hypothetical protein n=1 Tax=Geobacter sp. TaxID=46610 RepID=UPI00261FCCBA|nr:hypothetical protein [Geobacter sp.]
MAKKDTNYRYGGPLSGVTLDDGREVMLHPGAEVLLPADNDYVKTLVAQGFLTEVAEQSAQPSPPALSPREREPKNKEVTDAG